MEKLTCPITETLIEKEKCLAAQAEENAAEKCGECRHYYQNTPTFRLAQKLLQTEGLVGKLTYQINDDFFTWRFHENLSITVSTVENGMGYIEVNDGMLVMHPYAEDMYQNLVEIASGNVAVVTKMGIAGRYASGIYPLDYYRAKRKKLRFGMKTAVYTAKGEIE